MINTINCGCSAQRLLTLVTQFYIIILISACCLGSNSYNELLDRLKNSVRDNFNGDILQSGANSIELSSGTRTLNCVAGKVCKHDLTKLFGKHEPLKKAIEIGTDLLPVWLLIKNDKLIAVPVNKDIGSYKIVFSGLRQQDVYLEINIIHARKSIFKCSSSDDVVIGSIMLNADVSTLEAAGRLSLLRKVSNFINIDMHRAVINEGRLMNGGSLFGSSVLSAGPGDILIADKPGITYTWKIKCGSDVTGDRAIQMLKSGAADGSIKHDVGYSVIGWYVTLKSHRFRRQVQPNPQGTPLPSLGPTQPKATKVMSMGTPMPSATPSVSSVQTVVIMKSSMAYLSPSASSSTKAIVSTISPSPSSMIMPTTPVPKTMPPTTTGAISPMTNDSTTEKPTTKSPMTNATTPTSKPTTELPSTTSGTTPTKKIPPKTMPPTIPGNRRPALMNPIGEKVLYPNQLLVHYIEDDMFYDKEDGNTSNLDVHIKMVDGNYHVEIPTSFWLQYDTINRVMYALPGYNSTGTYRFVVVATDSEGASRNDTFTIQVNDDIQEHNNVFNVTIDTNFDDFTSSLWNKVVFMQRLASATKTLSQELRLKDIQRGSVIFAWSSEKVEQSSCNSNDAAIYEEMIGSSEFKNALAPDYIVINSGYYREKPCDIIPGGHGNDDGSGWWSKIIIPIIVVIVILLIIAVICCCCYRRKRKYEPPKEDTNGYLYNKKPVIFREEFEEKPDLVCLEPLILPNEKPPVSTPYAPRSSTPDGAGSSTISTESDEKAPLTASSTLSKDTPRKPHGRSPPPYNN